MLFSSLSGRINTAWSYYFIPEEKTRENAVVDCQQTDLYAHKDPGTSASTGLSVQPWDAESHPSPQGQLQGELSTAGSPAVLSSSFPPLNFSQLLSKGKEIRRGKQLGKARSRQLHCPITSITQSCFLFAPRSTAVRITTLDWTHNSLSSTLWPTGRPSDNREHNVTVLKHETERPKNTPQNIFP